MQRHTLTTSAAAVLLACASLVGCDRHEEYPSNSNDTLVGQAERTGKELSGDVKQGWSETREAVGDAAAQAKQAGKDAADTAGDKVADAMITSSVNAELAKDKSLSALQINVDTDAGRVALHGVAPSASARERATRLASAVKGVVSVDNQLTVEAPKS